MASPKTVSIKMDDYPILSVEEGGGNCSVMSGDVIIATFSDDDGNDIREAFLIGLATVISPTEITYCGDNCFGWLLANFVKPKRVPAITRCTDIPQKVDLHDVLGLLADHADRLVEKYTSIVTRDFDDSLWGHEIANDFITSMREHRLDLNDWLFDIESAASCLSRPYIDSKRSPYSGYDEAQDALIYGVSRIIGFLYPMFDIERIFEHNVKTNARWLFPGNVIDDFKESYKSMVHFLVGIVGGGQLLRKK